jgi:hypothetical protein
MNYEQMINQLKIERDAFEVKFEALRKRVQKPYVRGGDNSMSPEDTELWAFFVSEISSIQDKMINILLDNASKNSLLNVVIHGKN